MNDGYTTCISENINRKLKQRFILSSNQYKGQFPLEELPPRQLPPENYPVDNSHLEQFFLRQLRPGQLPLRISALGKLSP